MFGGERVTELHCLGGGLYSFFHESTLLLRYCWRTFFQRGNAGDPQAYEKMLKITNHQESENQTTTSHHLTPVRMPSKRTQITNVAEDLKKREPLYTVGRNINWYSHC